MKTDQIILIGPSGSGKTSVGRKVAEKLGWKFIDIDRVVTEKTGRTIPQIFVEQGEAYFREQEREALRRTLRLKRIVIATGGGIVTDPESRKLLKEGFVVTLTASPQTLFERIGDPESRPLLAGRDPMTRIHQLLSERSPWYQEADCLLETTGKALEEVVDELMGKIDEDLDR